MTNDHMKKAVKSNAEMQHIQNAAETRDEVEYEVSVKRKMLSYKKKGKSVSLQAWSDPEGSRKLRFSDLMTTAQGGGKVVSLTHRPHLPPGNSPGTYFCQRLSQPQSHSAVGRIMSMKNPNDTIWKRTSENAVISLHYVFRFVLCRSRTEHNVLNITREKLRFFHTFLSPGQYPSVDFYTIT